MAMNPDLICRMSSEQIATALDRLRRELTALQDDMSLLQAERDRRMSVIRTRLAHGRSQGDG
jgi:hypothetical protein